MNFSPQLIASKKHKLAKQKVKLSSMFNLICAKVLGMIIFTVLSFQIQANSLDVKPTLTIVPEQCVALLQGQACYVTVDINWQTPEQGNYCLYSSLSNRPIQCWQDKKNGELSQEFVSKNNIKFFLRLKNSKENIANIEINMAWVHKRKGRPRTSWRMF